VVNKEKFRIHVLDTKTNNLKHTKKQFLWWPEYFREEHVTDIVPTLVSVHASYQEQKIHFNDDANLQWRSLNTNPSRIPQASCSPSDLTVQNFDYALWTQPSRNPNKRSHHTRKLFLFSMFSLLQHPNESFFFFISFCWCFISQFKWHFKCLQDDKRIPRKISEGNISLSSPTQTRGSR